MEHNAPNIIRSICFMYVLSDNCLFIRNVRPGIFKSMDGIVQSAHRRKLVLGVSKTRSASGRRRAQAEKPVEILKRGGLDSSNLCSWQLQDGNLRQMHAFSSSA